MNQILALYGAGKKSLLAEQRLRRNASQYQARYLVENRDFTKLGQLVPRLDGDLAPLEVISLARLAQLHATGQCRKALIPCAYHLFDLREARQFVAEAGFAAEDVLAMPFNCIVSAADADCPQPPVVPYDDMEMIFHLDIHIVDHCNLKCKACAHFSSLVEGEATYSASEIGRSLQRLSELVPNICSISLLGGEPLLHPELAAIAQHARRFFPHACINITTNGILLKKIPLAVVQTLKDNNIKVDVSLYPPMQAEVDALATWLRESGLRWGMARADSFERRILPKPVFAAQQGFEKCGHIMCLRGSCVGYCVMALFTDYYNKRFGAGKLPEDRGVDIFSVQSGAELLRRLRKPLELCRQCVSRDAGQRHWQAWEPAGAAPQASDWFITVPSDL